MSSPIADIKQAEKFEGARSVNTGGICLWNLRTIAVAKDLHGKYDSPKKVFGGNILRKSSAFCHSRKANESAAKAP